MGDGEGWYRNLVAAGAQCLADRVIVREAIGKGLKAADLRQRRAPERQRRAEARTRQAEREADHHARQKLCVDHERAQSRPDAGDGNAVVEAGHGADAGLCQRRDDAGQVVGAHPHVAVGEDDNVMADARRHVDEVGDLPIQSVRLGFDDEIDIAVGLRRAKALDDGNGVVVAVLHAADDLHGAGIVLDAERGEVVEKSRLIAVKWLEHGDPRRGRRARGRTLARAAADEDRGRDQVPAADQGDDRRRDRRPEQDHGSAQWLYERGLTGSRAGCLR